MICLKPLSESTHACPNCHTLLDVRGWYIPGMRMLADLVCPQCGCTFYGDLPSGHGYDYPCLLDRQSGQVFGEHPAQWFTTWLKDSWQHRTNIPLPFEVESFREVKRPILLNCLDVLYGHALLKLLSAQFHIEHHSHLDLIVLVPRFLRWMVPEGVAAIWTVELPLRQGTQWNDWLAQQIQSLLEPFGECWLSPAVSHPQLDSFDIERFTKVKPFNMQNWVSTPTNPVVTLIWREDRTWSDPRIFPLSYQLELKLRRRLKRPVRSIWLQLKAFCNLASLLQRKFPQVEIAVIGLGTTGQFPNWVRDMRSSTITAKTEEEWCKQYARSHVVVGIHGSNMLLPSALAATVVDLMPSDRWGNVAQDILLPELDSRRMAFRCQFVPMDSSIESISQLVQSLLIYMHAALCHFDLHPDYIVGCKISKSISELALS